jgi:tryptophan-rich sensory protein
LPVAETKRSGLLTLFAVLFLLAAIEDLLKPFRLEGPTTGLVFFGTRLSGLANAVIAPVVGIFLLIYAAGIWRMQRYTVYLAYGYAIYVTINLVLFTTRNPPPKSQGELVFGVVYTILALVITWSSAIVLRRNMAQLSPPANNHR